MSIEITEQDIAKEAAIEILVRTAFAWVLEYGFSDPETAQEVWDAAKLLRPDMEPRE